MTRNIVLFTVTLIIFVSMFTVLCGAVDERDNIPSEHTVMDHMRVDLSSDSGYTAEINVDDQDITIEIALEDLVKTDRMVLVTVTINLIMDSSFQLERVTHTCLGNMSMDGQAINSDSSMLIVKNELCCETYYVLDDNQRIRLGTGFVSQFDRVSEKPIGRDYIQQSFQIVMYEDTCKLNMNMIFNYRAVDHTLSVLQVIDAYLHVE